MRLVYQRGAFGTEDTAVVAALLAIFALAVPAWVVQQTIVRAFYARSDTWRPMVLGTAVALLAIPLYWFGGQRYGATGLASAGAIAMSANALAILILARSRHRAPRFRLLVMTAFRSFVVAAPSAALTRLALEHFGDGTLLRDLAIGLGCFAACAGVGILLVGDEVLRGAARRVLSRLWNRNERT